MKRLMALLAAGAMATAVSHAHADGMDEAHKPAARSMPIQWEAGIRYWYSTGRMAKDLYDVDDPTTKVSRLTYDQTAAHSGEVFFRGDHKATGLFVKGYVGAGSIVSGKMNDEDFLVGAGFIPSGYSNTLQETHNGDLRYFSGDLGWTFYDGTKYLGSIKDGDHHGMAARLGAFVGYHYWREFARTYGCLQLATPGSVCSPSPVTSSTYTLGQDNIWRSLRLGVTGDVLLGHRWTLSGDMAVTRTELDGEDHHKLRPDIDPLNETGTGWGIQLEGIAKYNVTDMFNIGVGARWWRNYTDGSVQFPGANGRSPERWETDRSGLFVQGGVKLN
jgi:hypothetical protein